MLLLTHIEFPAVYIQLVELNPLVIALVAARNVLLLACFGVALWRLSGWGSEAALRKARGLKMPAARRGSPV